MRGFVHERRCRMRRMDLMTMMWMFALLCIGAPFVYILACGAWVLLRISLGVIALFAGGMILLAGFITGICLLAGIWL